MSSTVETEKRSKAVNGSAPAAVHGAPTEIVHLRAEATSAVIAAVGGMPFLLHWGSALSDGDERALAAVLDRPLPRATLDTEAPVGLFAEVGAGFPGHPGIEGHRSDGSGFAPRFQLDRVERPTHSGCRWHLIDRSAGLGLTVDVDLCTETEVLRVGGELTNDGVDDYQLSRLAPSLALPAHATELLTLAGRWTAEFQPQRRPWPVGGWSYENRRGRTSHDRVPAVFAGTTGFDESSGEVWGVHLAWSGNHRMVADRLSDGRRYVQAGELLFPGEVTLEPGGSAVLPTVFGAHSDQGLGGVSRRFHRFVRSRDHHPGPDRPRPVLINTWEAVYFDHDLDTLKRLASRAAAVGVERFVLDDGWFLGRNDDTRALGDWTIDPAKYPLGLDPLIDHVKAEGMEFGLWFEPEMINPDSELYRAHPDWVLHDDDYELVPGRQQLVLDLVNPDAFDHVLTAIDAVLAAHDIAYVKWDMNRDLTQPTHDGRAGSRRQTLAFYDLLDQLRERHPSVEFESCSSGGARADFEVLARTERVWTSDCNDALDRQTIQRGFSMLFPPELMGSHVGPPTSHTTGRHHDLSLRVAAAFLGHFGIEWNLLEASDEDLADLAAVIEAHKRHRSLIHSGEWHRLEPADGPASTMGVVATDGSEAVFVHVRTATDIDAVPSPIRFTGLDPARDYRPVALSLPGRDRNVGRTTPRWMTEPDVTISGRALMGAGLQPPLLDPESAMIVHLGPA